jgi:hypothetical protein
MMNCPSTTAVLLPIPTPCSYSLFLLPVPTPCSSYLPGTSLEPPWNLPGTYLEPTWNLTGTYLEPHWNLSTILEPLRGTTFLENLRSDNFKKGPMAP